jgi:antitoxin (DNA-binding transcriptional repressor) of toxin-antitoxin stability system
VRAFDATLADPAAAQQARLASLLRAASPSVFFREHQLSVHMGIEDLRAAIPVRTHAELSPWLERVEAGESNVLTGGPVLHLVETSGTTGRPKRLPVNAAWIATCATAQRLWMLGLLRDDERLAGGKALSIVSPAEHARSSGNLPIGSNTGRIFLDQPWWTRRRAAVPYVVCTLDDPEIRAYTLLRHAIGKDIRSWTTANPSTILVYARNLARWWDALREDAADGTLRCGPAAALSSVERSRFSRGIIRTRLGDDPTPASLWPLRRINCWTGGAAGFFLEKLPDAIGARVPVREVGIHASEGTFAFTVDDGDPVAWLGGHLLEFREESGSIRSAWEVEVGREYELIVTTEAGLWRYAMGDIVRVTGWLGRAPRLVFARKVGSFLNATGEKVTENQVIAAAKRAFTASTAFCAATEWCDPPRIVIAVEGAPLREPLGDPLGDFDGELRRENIEYASKRESRRLGPAHAIEVPTGTFARWRATRIADGAPEAQVKDPVILNHERWIALVRS